jgi:hypothetical protein
MVEGDSFLSSELFCFVRTSKTSGYISENEEFSSAQKKIYFKRLRLEKYRVFVFLKRLEKAMNSFVSNVRFFFSKID